MPEGQRVTLSTGNWITIVVILTSAIGSNIALTYKLHSDVQRTIAALDDKWQIRFLDVTKDVKQDIKEVQKPPLWLETLVRGNQTSIEQIRDTIIQLRERVTRLEKSTADR